MEILREWERTVLPVPRPRVAAETMAGRWIKINDKPQWIGALDVRVDGDDLLVRVLGGGVGPSPGDWGVVRTTTVYAGDLRSGDALAGPGKVWTGIEANKLDWDDVVACIKAEREAGAKGFVLFEYLALRDKGWLDDLRDFLRPAAVAVGIDLERLKLLVPYALRHARITHWVETSDGRRFLETEGRCMARGG